MNDAARGSIQVTIACAAIGVIICVVTMTGIGSTLAFNIVAMTDNTLWMILLVVMLVCIVLSMGLPSTALYIVVAVTVSPILIKAGVLPLAAHFFVFWFGALSNITPPVALAATPPPASPAPIRCKPRGTRCGWRCRALSSRSFWSTTRCC